MISWAHALVRGRARTRAECARTIMGAVNDYPAAHSMDTEWFAVDADGNVARFDSGEDGAVPNAAAIGFSPGDASFDADLLRVACLAKRIAAEPPAEEGIHTSSARIVVLIEEGYRNAPNLDERFENLGPLLLSRERVAGDEVRRLAAMPGVRVFDLRNVLEAFEEYLPTGLYAFGRNHGDDPGLYRREAAPEHPLTVDALPKTVRAEIASLRLPVRFDASPELHLADHLANQDAMYWGEDWALRWPSTPPEAPPRPSVETRMSKLTPVMVVALIAAIVLTLLVLRR